MADGGAAASPGALHVRADDLPASLPVGPIVAPPGESAAAASHPDQPLEGERWHIYESNPAPWWIGLLWLAFFVFAVFYLIVNLLR